MVVLLNLKRFLFLMETNSTNTNLPREKVIWFTLMPQAALLVLSILWIYFFPQDNVLQYLKFNLHAILEGILTGIGLAITGYGFYRLSKKIKNLSSVAELFEQVLAPVFKNLKILDFIYMSIISGTCEEIFFRGLLFPRLGMAISSIAFGFLHMPGSKYWIYTLWATLSGALFALLFLLSGSLWLPITAHITNNIIGMTLLRKLKINN